MLRERRHFWSTRPSMFLLMSSVLGLGVALLLAAAGALMAPIRPALLLGVLGAGVVYFTIIDSVKVRIFEVLRLR